MAKIAEIKGNFDELDSELKLLKKKIEDDVFEITNKKYSILQSQD